MENLLISACLLGVYCKYDGGTNAQPKALLDALREKYRLVPVCPETASGLPCPREPSERVPGGVIGRSGKDVTEAFERGGEIALTLARRFGCKRALMKERSPSCGSGRIYDGTFSGTLVDGDGVAVEKLKAAGVSVYGESQSNKLL